MSRFVQRATSSQGLWIVSVCCVLAIVWWVRQWSGTPLATARTPAKPVAAKSTSTAATPGKPAVQGATADPNTPPIVALINGQTILRDELGRECLRLYGKEVLESVVNRRLIDRHCRSQGISISQEEIDAEIDTIARKFSLPKDQYLKMLEKERGIPSAQYGRDIIWPTLALRKLAAAKLTVTRAELEQAYESQFGAAVKARLIICEDRAQAEKVLKLALAKPDEFGVLARKYSQDINSASANGLIQPIRRHLGDPEIEQAAFQLKEGEISPIIEVANQFAILKCEGILPATQPDRKRFDAILAESIKDRKLRAAAAETFKTLQEQTKVQNVMNEPALSQKMPGVAALLDNEPITLHDLAEHCIERHGVDVLDGYINRCLLEQALRRKRLTMTDDDLHAELARAAVSMGKLDEQGKPDVEAWLKMVTEAQAIDRDVYLHDVVWPSAAMKKIVGTNINITKEDLQRGFEANYGPRVRCRAIVFNNHRRAQEVWDMARQELTSEHFGDLAEQYSIEANSRSLRGEIPPIQKWGGQPVLEREAFALKKGELSGIIQVGENYLVLFCEGYTKPIEVDFAAVKSQLEADIHEKKLRLAMADAFEKMKGEATIDNYLAGKTQSPKEDKELLADEMLQQRKGSVAPRGNTNTARSPARR
jgi:parvulin-like peptidyl-prolyl isomerase